MLRLEFRNSHDKPIYIQVDPWACLYKLNPGNLIEIVANCDDHSPQVSIDEYNADNRIVTLCNCEEFFVVKDGRPIHWTEYPNDTTG